MAQTRQRQRTRSRDDDAPIIPILARKVREVEQKAQKNKLGPTNRTKFQVIALLMREERARVGGAGARMFQAFGYEASRHDFRERARLRCGDPS